LLDADEIAEPLRGCYPFAEGEPFLNHCLVAGTEKEVVARKVFEGRKRESISKRAPTTLTLSVYFEQGADPT
jgi:hypothetical protein